MWNGLNGSVTPFAPMLSNGDASNNGEPSSLPTTQRMKERRIQRACDICRRKKIRCDGREMPGKSCLNCTSCKSQPECTYVEAAKKRSLPRRYVTYVEALKNKVDRFEKLLRQICPDETRFKKLCTALDGNRTIECPPISDITDWVQPDTADLASAIRGALEDNSDTSRSSTEHRDDDPNLILAAENLRNMALGSPRSPRFLGMSSGGRLIQTAIELKKVYTGDEGMLGVQEVLKNQRAQPREMKPWEQESYATPSPGYKFPDVDLAHHCTDLYFKCSNLYFPLLHRPTFEKDVKGGLHLKDERFASVFLLVCAVGARFSDNPQVLLDGVDMHHSSGWKWFEQVQIMKRSPLSPPNLYDLQIYSLCAQYLVGTSSPQSFWTMVGIGIRLAQDVGAHRRKIHKHTHTAEDELWKRAFWVLVCMDRTCSAALGRSCAIQDEEFDLDLPIDCDDEFWSDPDPEKCFKQPPNKPSSITAFILYLKLTQILGFSLRTIYSVNKPKILLGFVGQPWEQHVVAELDSALIKWVDSVPDHLRWDPRREDNNFFNQSASLYASYYDIQMNIHRPFIPSPGRPSPLTFPSLAICTNAARACSHILDSLVKRNPNPPPHIQFSAFTAGIVLLIDIWGGKRAGFSTDLNKEMADVHKCMGLLKTAEARWYCAGGLYDVLYEFACAGALPLPQPGPPSMKRVRESETQFSLSANDPLPSDPMSNEIWARAVAGSRRVLKESSFFGQTRQPPPQHLRPQVAPPPSATSTCEPNLPPSQQAPFINADFRMVALPVYTDELGTFPLHEQVTLGAQTHQSRPQTHSPQLHPQNNHWYTMPSTQGGGQSEPTSYAGLSGFNSSYWPPAPCAQQQRSHPNHTSQSIPSSGSSIAQGLYETGATPLATHTQPQRPSVSMGSSSALPQSSSGPSIENVYGRMGTDMLPDFTGGHSLHQHQHQGFPQQQREQPLTDPFVDMWWNAPAGFGLPTDWRVRLPTYLANLSEFKQGY